MKKVFIIVIFTLSLSACNSDDLSISQDCIYTATVVDLRGLDGCGYVFKLDNGDILEPIWQWGFCATPPIPKEVTEDPLWDFNFIEGQRVRLGFKPTQEMASICSVGKQVHITCVEVIGEAPVE